MSKIKKGDFVMMVDCLEALKHRDEVWIARTDSFVSASGAEVVFLDGYSGYFAVDCLEKVSAT